LAVADYFLSIHINSGGGTGFESYIYPGVGAPTSTYQSAVHTQVIQASGFNPQLLAASVLSVRLTVLSLVLLIVTETPSYSFVRIVRTF
jgi:N-acetylmuramoyl-L-alanine amidase